MAACDETPLTPPEKLRVLELYSGIGGMHWALKENGIPCEVVAAVDINNVANDVYRYNFKGVKIIQKVIESLSVSDLDKLSPDLITMSPPCQPFTRVGLQKDRADPRTKSFFHVLHLLPRLAKMPSYIFLENVKGFETSATYQQLMETLGSAGYQIQEFLVTPNQFGVPNSRLRYYLLAKRSGLQFNFPLKTGIRDDIPECMEPFLTHRISPQPQPQSTTNSTPTCSQTTTTNSTPPSADPNNENDDPNTRLTERPETENQTGAGAASAENPVPALTRERYQALCRSVSAYLEDRPHNYFTPYILPEKWLKRFWCMDIIKSSAKNCCCFTKAYGHHIEGAGSLLQTAEDSHVDLNIYKEKREADESAVAAVRALRLRFFTPREVANLMCFPQEFEFPESSSTVQCYRVLGNSLNVHVVSVLLRLLCWGDSASR